MFDGELTLDDIEREWAEYRAKKEQSKSRWTAHHDDLLVKMRDGSTMSWEDLAQFWKSKFGWGSGKTLNARYKELKAGDDD